MLEPHQLLRRGFSMVPPWWYSKYIVL